MNSVFKCLMSAVCAVALPAFGQEEKTGFPTDRAVTVFSAGEGNPYASIRIPALLSTARASSWHSPKDGTKIPTRGRTILL